MELASLGHSIVKPTKHSPGRVLGLRTCWLKSPLSAKVPD